MGVLAGILILSYYSVIAGWTLAYVVKSASGVFVGAARSGRREFEQFRRRLAQVGLSHTLFMALAIFVVARGVERGLEQAVRFMVPALLVLMLVLLGYSINSGYFGQGVAFMFTPDFGKLTWDSVLAAMGQAFFTLSIGMGAVMAYGAYLPEETSITGASAAVVIADTRSRFSPAWRSSRWCSRTAWIPLTVRAWFSYTCRWRSARCRAAFSSRRFSSCCCRSRRGPRPSASWSRPLPGSWSDLTRRVRRPRHDRPADLGARLRHRPVVQCLADFKFLAGTIFDNVDYLTSNIMLPLGGLLIVVFAGWVMCRNSTADELGESGTCYKLWRLLARFVAPIGILFVLLKASACSTGREPVLDAHMRKSAAAHWCRIRRADVRARQGRRVLPVFPALVQ